MAIKTKIKVKRTAPTDERTEAQKRGRRSKNKGANYERKIAKTFKEVLDVELTRTPQSGGFAKKSQKADSFRGDIVCLEEDKDLLLSIECKNQQTLAMRKWLNQAEDDCPEGKIPVVIYYLGQVIKDNKVKEEAKGDYITLKLDDFLKLVPSENIVKEV